MYQPQLACLGLSHRTAPVELRERAACSLEDFRTTKSIVEPGRFDAIREFSILSTCNRLEIYAAVDRSIADAGQLLLALLAAGTGVESRALAEHSYQFTGIAVVEHLARVAAGLESLVLGESQILGQVSRAHVEALEARTICTVLEAVMLTAVRAGKRVHAETLISSKPVSISSVAVGTAERLLGSLRRRRILVVGLGEMGTQALKTLRGRNVDNIMLANRSVERAQRIADENQVSFCGLADLPHVLAEADVVICATGAQGYMIDSAMVAEAQQRRQDRPLLLIDIAVPRDIDPAVVDLAGVHYFDIDHLNQGVDEALAVRRREVPQAEQIVAQECADFEDELRRLAVEPIVADFRLRAEAMRRQALERTLRFIGPDVDPETAAHIDHLTHALVNKLLHEPTVRLKEHASNGDANQVVPTFRDLFGLSDANGSPRNGDSPNGKSRS